MSTTHDPIAHAARLLREAAQELKHAHTIGGIAEWDGTEPEAQAVYDDHMAAAEAIEEWESAVGAGGIGPLRRRECLLQITEPAIDLHAEIMNIPRKASASQYAAAEWRAYIEGHRDARHAAAELALSATPASPAQQAAQSLTDEEIDRIADGMPGGLDGFLKGWGWRQFARAVLNAATQPTRQPLTDEQWQAIADATGLIISRGLKDQIENILSNEGSSDVY